MNRKYVIALSFANYLKDKTGIPKVMMAHQQMYNQEQISYVALFSVKKNILNDRMMLFCKFGLIIDGEYRGIYQMSQILQLLADWQNEGKILLDIHLHHFMYMKISLVDELLRAAPSAPIKAYLHDYYNACAGHNLMKNGEFFCGGTGFSQEKCGDCVYYEKSRKIQKQIHDLFQRYLERILFVSPSETTKRIYLNFHPEYREKVLVIPHQTYTATYQNNLEPVKADERLRIAYLGMPAKHKGWYAWEKIIEHAPRQRYVFTVFNSSDEQHAHMDKVKIAFSKENLNAMTCALREYQVHIAVLWSLCPETYSYTCSEAYSANAFIITNINSGNIADMVKKKQCGLVLFNEEELLDLFADADKLRDLVNQYRAHTAGGPLELQENRRIAELSMQSGGTGEIVCGFRKPVNFPLLWLLNRIYK